jgi:anti-anti-sigma factor
MSTNPKSSRSFIPETEQATLVEADLSCRDSSQQRAAHCEASQDQPLRLRSWAQNTGLRTIIHCEGDIRYQREADYLVKLISEFDEREVVIDLKHVNSVDAYGLGKLLDLYQLLTGRGQCLTLANPSERLQMLFNITKLEFCFMCASGRLST